MTTEPSAEQHAYVIVSNREPYEHRQSEDGLVLHRPTGGLTAALDQVLGERGGAWVAWGSGNGDFAPPHADGHVQIPGTHTNYHLYRVPLKVLDVAHYYNGYANRVLWPVCHLALERVRWRRTDWQTYQHVNWKFAEKVAAVARQGAHVWIHDYHLALVGKHLRELRPDLRIGMFWHIPWPAYSALSILTEAEALVEGLLGCDLIGFQSGSYAIEFLDCVDRLRMAGTDRTRRIIEREGRRIEVGVFPISVDVTALGQASAEEEGTTQQLLEKLGVSTPDFFLGVDRIDYAKGIDRRLAAVETFYAQYPEQRGKSQFLQIAVPSREGVPDYQELRQRLKLRARRINARFGSRAWQPVVYVERSLEINQLVLLYRATRAMVVTSLMDGMNLVAKEFIVAQNGREEPGALLLSHRTGAAEELDGYISINPFDREGMAEAMRHALEIPVDERLARARRLYEQVARHDIFRWAEDFLAALAEMPREVS